MFSFDLKETYLICTHDLDTFNQVDIAYGFLSVFPIKKTNIAETKNFLDEVLKDNEIDTIRLKQLILENLVGELEIVDQILTDFQKESQAHMKLSLTTNDRAIFYEAFKETKNLSLVHFTYPDFKDQTDSILINMLEKELSLFNKNDHSQSNIEDLNLINTLTTFCENGNEEIHACLHELTLNRYKQSEENRRKWLNFEIESIIEKHKK